MIPPISVRVDADQEAVVMGLWAELEAEWAVRPVDADEPVQIARQGS